MANENAATVTFSKRELDTLAMAWQCIDGNPQPDIKKLAPLAGYTEGSCRNAWTAIRKKLNAIAEGATVVEGASMAKGNGTNNIPSTPATVRKRKSPVKKSAADEENEDEDESPTKKAKPGSKPRGKAKAKTEDADEGGDANGAAGTKTPAKRGRKPKTAKQVEMEDEDMDGDDGAGRVKQEMSCDDDEA